MRLDPGTTKNGEGRTFPFTAALEALLKAQKAEHERLKKANRIVPLVFHRDGKRIKHVRAALGNRLHDGRRARPHPARLPTHRRPEPRARRRLTLGGDGDGRTQDRGDLPAVRDRRCGRAPRRCGEDRSRRGHNLGHSRRKSAGSDPQRNPRKCLILELVPEEGVEPSRPEGHGILSPARLPVSPLRPGWRPKYNGRLSLRRLPAELFARHNRAAENLAGLRLLRRTGRLVRPLHAVQRRLRSVADQGF